MGGIKEKIIACQRSGISTVILPAANKRDYDDVPEFIRSELTVHFVENYRDVYPLLFNTSLNVESDNKLRKILS